MLVQCSTILGPTHLKGMGWGWVWLTLGQLESTSTMNSGISVPFTSGDGPLLTSCVNCNGSSWNCAKVTGDRHDPGNYWQWETVCLNLPRLEFYDPSMPRVMLLRKDGELATREANYVHNIHLCIWERDRSFESCHACAQLKLGMNFRGNQVDNQKDRFPTVTPGASNGVIVHTNTLLPIMPTTKERWTHFKEGISWILSEGRATGSL